MGGMEVTEVGRQTTSPSLISKRKQEVMQVQHLDHLSKRLKTEAPSTSPLLHTSTQVEVDPLDLRWSILKELLPQDSKLQAETDDLLKVVFEYVQDLETEIKTFKHEDYNATKTGASKEDMGALQKKGLCIVPLLNFTTAF